MSTATYTGTASINRTIAKVVSVIVVVAVILFVAYKATFPSTITRTVCDVQVTASGDYKVTLADGRRWPLSEGKILKPGVTYVFEDRLFSDPVPKKKAATQEAYLCTPER